MAARVKALRISKAELKGVCRCKKRILATHLSVAKHHDLDAAQRASGATSLTIVVSSGLQATVYCEADSRRHTYATVHVKANSNQAEQAMQKL